VNRGCRTVLYGRHFFFATLILLLAPPAFAQVQGRVSRDGSMIWRSDAAVVAATAQAGTVLSVTARSDSWFEIVIPESLGGRGERGLIAASQVLLAAGTGVPPCRVLRGNPCSNAGPAESSVQPSRAALTTTAIAAQPAPTPAAQVPVRQPQSPAPSLQSTPVDLRASSLAPGLFVQFGAGGTDVPAAGGGALLGGVSVGFSRVLVSFNAGDWVLYPGDTGGYYRDYFDNGQSRCRGPNGQFATDESCIAIESLYAYSIDAVGLIPASPVLLGGGIRFEGDTKTWFGSAGAGWIRNGGKALLSLRGNFGQDYVSGLVTIAFRVAGPR
jgi:hypothetical protein